MNQQTAFNNILTPITQRINRDDIIDEAETINNGIDGDFEYDDSFKNKLIFPMENNPLASNRKNKLIPILNQKKDDSNDSLEERIKPLYDADEIPLADQIFQL